MNNRGYTLIEMAVVVLLIGLMIGIAIPSVRDTLSGDSLRKAARQMIGMSRELRSDSVREQVDYELHIDIDGQRFWAYGADMTAEKRYEVKKRTAGPPAGVRIRGVQLFGSEKQTQGEAVIRFFSRGYVQPARIYLGSGESELALVFNPYIPEVEIDQEGGG